MQGSRNPEPHHAVGPGVGPEDAEEPVRGIEPPPGHGYPLPVQGAALRPGPVPTRPDAPVRWTPRMSTLRTLVLLAFLLGSAACSSPGSGRARGTHKVLVTLRDYRAALPLELASETHTDRVSYYSHERHDAARKVQTDPVMAALVDELDERGFESHAAPGTAPTQVRADVVRWALAIEIDGQAQHWLVGPGTQADEWKAFQGCRDAFVQLYNVTVSYQSVQNASGGGLFQDDAGKR